MGRAINPRRQGDLGEASAIEWLASIGATVFVPIGHSRHVDLVAAMDGRLWRVQVKTSVQRTKTPTGKARYPVQLATRGGNQSWNGTVKRIDPNAFEVLFVLVGNGRRWAIPARALEAETSIILGGDKYAEYEVMPGMSIDAQVESDRGSASTIDRRSRGSADVGESGGTVNSVLPAEWVRIPPPPSLDDDIAGGGATSVRIPRRREHTRISSTHQVTIPSTPFRDAQLEVGDRLHVQAEAPGRLVVERIAKAPAPPFLTAANGAPEERPVSD